MSKRKANAAAETVADYDVRSPAIRTVISVLGTLVGVALICGLVLGLSILVRKTQVSTSQVDVGQNSQLVINATSADIEVVEGEPDLLTITSSITSGLRPTDYQIGRKGEEIKIVSACQRWLNPGCGVKTRVEVPPGMALTVRTTVGQVRVEPLSGGVLTVRTTTGNVTATDLGVDEFTADTRLGNVEVTFAKQPFGFKASTTSGKVTAGIPPGELTYAVTTDTASGTVDSSIESDDEGQGFIRVTSRSGNIVLETIDPPEEDS